MLGLSLTPLSTGDKSEGKIAGQSGAPALSSPSDLIKENDDQEGVRKRRVVPVASAAAPAGTQKVCLDAVTDSEREGGERRGAAPEGPEQFFARGSSKKTAAAPCNYMVERILGKSRRMAQNDSGTRALKTNTEGCISPERR